MIAYTRVYYSRYFRFQFAQCGQQNKKAKAKQTFYIFILYIPAKSTYTRRDGKGKSDKQV